MPVLLQIDSCLGVGSTGRITESIGNLAMTCGWDCYIAHGARYVGTTKMHSVPVVTKFGEYRHALKSMLFDRHGLGSVYETKQLIKKINEIKPDVIHLHCVHGYYLNYKVLFEYLNSTEIPIVWTFHDCWAFTGHCAYFDSINCDKWQYFCSKCILHKDYPASLFVDNSKRNFYVKRELFTKNKNLTIVPVSKWLENLVKLSFFKTNSIKTIHNGVDLNVFKPTYDTNLLRKFNLQGRFVILGVAAQWDKRKGLDDFIQLRSYLDDNYIIVLVGLTKEQLNSLPDGILGLSKTNNVSELATLYSCASIYVNPTYSDNFPTTNLEALACGTPVITYQTGGSPEAIDNKTGIVVSKGDIQGLVSAVRKIKSHPLSSDDCRSRAVALFDREERFRDYIELYEKLLKESRLGHEI